MQHNIEFLKMCFCSCSDILTLLQMILTSDFPIPTQASKHFISYFLLNKQNIIIHG